MLASIPWKWKEASIHILSVESLDCKEMRADVSHLLAPFTLGVRLDVDFDQFFRRDDALSQLQHWRKARW